MSKVIRVSDSIFKRLQGFATPLVDTPASVIERLLDFYENHNLSSKTQTRQHVIRSELGNNNDIFILDPKSPEDLTFTKIIDSSVGSTKIKNWIEFIKEVHKLAYQNYGSFEELRNRTKSNIVPGSHKKKGFHKIAEINISIQGENANTTWRNGLYLAKQLKIPIEINFKWRAEEKAAHPNKQGKLIWPP